LSPIGSKYLGVLDEFLMGAIMEFAEAQDWVVMVLGQAAMNDDLGKDDVRASKSLSRA
jgi:hypothetical protein